MEFYNPRVCDGHPTQPVNEWSVLSKFHPCLAPGQGPSALWFLSERIALSVQVPLSAFPHLRKYYNNPSSHPLPLATFEFIDSTLYFTPLEIPTYLHLRAEDQFFVHLLQHIFGSTIRTYKEIRQNGRHRSKHTSSIDRRGGRPYIQVQHFDELWRMLWSCW